MLVFGRRGDLYHIRMLRLAQQWRSLYLPEVCWEQLLVWFAKLGVTWVGELEGGGEVMSIETLAPISSLIAVAAGVAVAQQTLP